MPGACALIGELMWVFFIRRDTPLYLKGKGRDAEALEQFSRVCTYATDIDKLEDWDYVIKQKEKL